MTQMSEPGCPTSHNYSPRLGNSDSFDSATDAVVENHRTRQKRQAIVDACQHGDIGKLRTLAQEDGGFLDDETRRLAWPILLGPPASQHQDCDSSDGLWSTPWQTLAAHRDEDQVALDVKRAFIYYPRNQPETRVKTCKDELSDLIIEILRRYPYLCYFQGYHDICQVMLLVLEPASRPQLLARLTLLRIRDFMLPSLSPTVAQLNLLPEIIERADPELRRHVAGIEPFYALAGTLTMFAHNIQDYHDIARLFDVLLCREPVFSIYLFAQIILDRRSELLHTPSDDTAMLHFILSKVPANIDLDGLIGSAATLFDVCRTDSLPSWRKLSRFSVFKTTSSANQCASQTLENGCRFFHHHARELVWADARAKVSKRIWQHRRLVQITGSAIAAVLIAMYLRRNQHVVHQLAATLAQYIKWP